MKMTLTARSPFSLPVVVRSHGWYQLAPFQEQPYGLSYTARLDSGRVVDLEFRAASGGVTVSTQGELEPAERDQVADMTRWMFGLNQDFADFYQHARHEPRLAHVEATGGGRVLRSPSLFEDTVKTILTTNTTWAGTKRMNLALIQTFGEPLPGEPDRQAFPTPQALAAADLETLRSGVRLGYRAPYVLELARKVDSGELDLEALKGSDLATPELRKRLLSIKGIGAYAAANLLMILGRYDFIPIDSWAFKMVSQEWYDGGPVGPAEVETAFQAWGAWKGLAYWFWDWKE